VSLLKKIRREIKSNPKKLFLFFFLLIFWAYFREGGETTISFQFKKNNNDIEIYIDRARLYSISLPENEKVQLTSSFFPTFVTEKQIKQKVKYYFILEGTDLSRSQKEFSSMFLKDLRGKILGVKINNLEQCGVHLENENGGKLSVYLRPLRENDWSVAKTENGKEKFLLVDNHILLDWWQQLRKIFSILVLPFPFLAMMALLSPLIKIEKTNRYAILKKELRKYKIMVLILFGLFLGGSFFWLYYLNQHYLEGIPHVGDAVSYLMQAKFMAEGKVCGIPKIKPELLVFFKDWGATFFKNGRWCGFYPYGHPLMLAVGILLGNPGVIPPLLASFSLLFMYLIGKKIANFTVGVISGLIMFSSPFFQMNAASFMSHNSAVFFETAGLYFLIQAVDQAKRRFFILSSLFFGLLFNNRPLTVLGIVFPIGFFLLVKRVKFKDFSAFVSSGIVFCLTYFIYNFWTNGNWVNTHYLQMNSGSFIQGRFFIINYLLVFQTYLLTFLKVFHGWPYLITLFLFFLPLLVAKKKEILFIFTCVLGITLTWSFFDGGTYAITYGPRYWLEVTPFVIFLLAFSFYYLANLLENKLYKVIIYFCFFGLLTFTNLGWIEGAPVLWANVGFTPANIEGLKTFNYTDARLIKKAKELKIKNAVIFVKDCGGNWWCYGSVLPQNNPELDSEIVWALDLGERNKELMDFYEGRRFYLADYEKGEILSY